MALLPWLALTCSSVTLQAQEAPLAQGSLHAPRQESQQDSAHGKEHRQGRTASRPLIEGKLDELQAEFLPLYETQGTAQSEEFDWKLVKLQEGRDYVCWELSFPSPLPGPVAANNTVHARYWTPRGELQDMPAAVVLHWLGGNFEVLDVVCAGLARKGVCALMVFMPHYGPRRVGINRMVTIHENKLRANFRQAVLDVRRAGDWLADQPQIDSQRIGIVGISLGSMVAELVAGIDLHFSRSVFLIGGGDLASVVLNESRETRAVRTRAKELGLTLEDLREQWRSLEPLTWASRIAAESVYMVAATEDEIIPIECTWALQEAIGVEEIHWFEGGHYAIVFPILDLIDKAATHLASVRPVSTRATD